MNQECLKLTSYFGERNRVQGRFVAEALADLYGAHEIATSIVLRGLEGFGLHQHLRTDHSLSLSEDLPLVAIAVDTAKRVEAVLEETVRLNNPGLVTLERARLLTEEAGPVGEICPAALPGELGAAAKLTIYVGRKERVSKKPAFMAVCDLLHRRGIAGATALLGVDGTVHGERQRARFFAKNSEVPMMIVAVAGLDQALGVLPELGGLVERPLVTLERVRVCKRDGERLELPESLPGEDEHGMALWQKLTVYTSEALRHEGQPVHRAITRKLRASGASGATTLRGLWGFHGDHQPHGDRALQLGRRVPVVTIVIDSPERIATAFAIVDEVTSEAGLVTSETVPAMRAAAGGTQRGGLRLASHHLEL